MKKQLVLKIHPAGMVVFAAAFLFCDSHLVLACVIALLLHEGAHLLVMRLCGMRACTVELTPFGGMADPKAFDTFKPWKRAVSAAAGAAASGCAAYACMCFAPKTPFWHACFQANLSLAMLNSLPAWPLDGARVLAAAASSFGCEQTVKKLLSAVTVLLGLSLTALGLAGVWKGFINPSLLVAGPYLCYAAKAEKLSEKVRLLDSADQKLQTSGIMPVKLLAGGAEITAENASILLGRMPPDRYHLLVRIDPSSGKIEKWWTETELLKNSLSTEEIDDCNPVDKAKGL